MDTATEERIKARLKLDEGWKPSAYQDSNGYWTIGWGFLIDAKVHGEIPVPIAQAWLDYKIKEKEAELEQHDWYLCQDDVRKSALVNMAFNLGVQKLLEFPIFLDQIKRKDYKGAADNLEGTRWHVQTGPRADRVIALIRDGAYPP